MSGDKTWMDRHKIFPIYVQHMHFTNRINENTNATVAAVVHTEVTGESQIGTVDFTT